MLDELIFFMLMAVGVTYLDDGGPYAGNYGCPAYCAVNHKHLAFKDTLVVSSAMAKNNNKSMLGGFLDYWSGRLGTEIDSLPSGKRSLDNLKEMKSFMDTYQDAKQAQAVAVADMRNAGMDVDILPKSDLAFKQAKAVSTNTDRLVDEVNFNINNPKLSPFEEYIMEAEGWHGAGLESVEGGAKTIGYGHKMKEGIDYSFLDNFSKQDAINLMRDDIKSARLQAKRSTVNKYGKDSWGNMSEKQKNMLIDFVYNTGQTPWMLEPTSVGRFTRFGDAIVKGDEKGMKALEDGEWIGARYFTDRAGRSQSLGRNKLYREFFNLK